MAKIAPFYGIHFNKTKIKNFSLVVTPPYDVIDSKAQLAFYKRNKFNFIRLDLGRTYNFDNEKNNRYTRAAGLLREWQKKGILIKEKVPTIYYIEEIFKAAGENYRRKGFISLVKVEDFSEKVVLPHEKTLSKPKEDRLSLMLATGANFSQVFSLFPDKKNVVNSLFEAEIKGVPPFVEVTDDIAVVHKMWKIQNKEVIKKVVDEMKEKQLFIADGHHRYETAIAYRNIMREKYPKADENSSFNYTPMYLSCMDDKGLAILPTHRAVFNLKDYKNENFLKGVKKLFNVEKVDEKRSFGQVIAEKGAETTALGLVMKSDNSLYTLSMKKELKPSELLKGKVDSSLAGLDVLVLHSLILGDILKISLEAQEKKLNLHYMQDIDELINSVKNGKYQLGFILNPTKIEQMKNACLYGAKMPQKSTFFYPKIMSGFVIYEINPSEKVAS